MASPEDNALYRKRVQDAEREIRTCENELEEHRAEIAAMKEREKELQNDVEAATRRLRKIVANGHEDGPMFAGQEMADESELKQLPADRKTKNKPKAEAKPKVEDKPKPATEEAPTIAAEGVETSSEETATVETPAAEASPEPAPAAAGDYPGGRFGIPESLAQSALADVTVKIDGKRKTFTDKWLQSLGEVDVRTVGELAEALEKWKSAAPDLSGIGAATVEKFRDMLAAYRADNETGEATAEAAEGGEPAKGAMPSGASEIKPNEYGIFAESVGERVTVPTHKMSKTDVVIRVAQTSPGLWRYGYDWQQHYGNELSRSESMTTKGETFAAKSHALDAAAAAIMDDFTGAEDDDPRVARILSGLDAYRKELGVAKPKAAKVAAPVDPGPTLSVEGGDATAAENAAG